MESTIVKDGEDELFIDEICEILKQHDGYNEVNYSGVVTGGIINKAGLFNVDGKPVFVKYADRENAYGMFTSEYESLKLIQATETIQTPQPYKLYKVSSTKAFFSMEFMDGLKPMCTLWEELGKRLASLHKYNSDLLQNQSQNKSSLHKNHETDPVVKQFGFNHTTYIGHSFEVQPSWESDWLTFFSRKKIQPQFDKIESSTGDAEFRELWSELQILMDIPFRGIKVEPSIIHGDFCTINIGEWKQQTVLFDPGCYYGHSEMDFIIPTMENNFPDEFYSGYYQVFPKQHQHYETREKLYQLYTHTMIYNQCEESEFRLKALELGQDLLSLLKLKQS